MIRCVSGPLHNKFSSENGMQFIHKPSGELYVKLRLEPNNNGPSFIEYLCFNYHQDVLMRSHAVKYCFLCLGYPVLKNYNCDYTFARYIHEHSYPIVVLNL